MFLMKEHVGKLISDIRDLICRDVRPVSVYRMKRTMEESPDAASMDTSDWEILNTDHVWGGHREYFYFETKVTIPEEWSGRQVVYELRTGKEGEWDALNPQFLVYINGEPRMGFDVNHRTILLTENAAGGEVFTIFLASYSGDNNFSLHLDSEIKILEPEIEGYYYDLDVPYQVARLLPQEDENRILIIKSLDASLRLLDLRREYSPEFFESLAEARAWLLTEFYDKYCGRGDAPVVYCVGHTHIDVAWLWTLRVTRDKARRSFTTFTEMMKQYPEFIFMSSQPQLYQYVKEDAPELYEQIKERVREGRWEAEGGMWLEADCNLSSGESLVRQFLHGIRFFRQEFGVKNEILWLPDVFGYSAALPQIMRKSGIRYFMTTKISWNERNKMPYDTFMWEGIDGSEVLTHFVPTRDYGVGAKEDSTETAHFTTYNGFLNSSQVMGAWQRYSQKDLNREVLMSYGFGDGGGGVTKEMLENQRRLEKGIPGAPRTVSSTALTFFRELEKKVKDREELPRWVGELYLEYHRGTYTTMARNKRFNRRAEFACENLELYATLAAGTGAYNYPAEALDECWKTLLRNQFHDILPGSGIYEIYEDSRDEYEHILNETDSLSSSALEVLSERIAGTCGDVIVFNPNSKSTGSPVFLPKDECTMLQGNAGGFCMTDGEDDYPLQETADGYFAVVDHIPSKGYRSFRLAEKKAAEEIPADSLKITEEGAETPYFKVTWNEKGQFTGIYDKAADRELLPEGTCGNVIMSYEDRPHNYDAWDINHYYKEKSWEVDRISSLTVEEEGPLRACLRIERPYLGSVIVQYVYFYRDLYRIDIRNEIDWKEKNILLRCYYPVDVHASEATYEIQYGNVKRPAHFNTSCDDAKFEVCAHKWIDFSEDDYGLSVINDCKYGCDIHSGRIGLTMLKSAVYPNPMADKEHHTFTWSLCPHTGRWQEADTVAKAYLLNDQYRAVIKKNHGGTLPAAASFVSVDVPNVVIETVKKAEDSDRTVIRMYECWNRRSTAVLTFDGTILSAAETNLLEEEAQPLSAEGNRLQIGIRPYEIKTIMVDLAR